MDYTKTKELCDAVDNLETYCKLHNNELNKEHCCFGEAARYSDCIRAAREVIFNLVEKSQ
jgi:hypothetical protein